MAKRAAQAAEFANRHSRGVIPSLSLSLSLVGVVAVFFIASIAAARLPDLKHLVLAAVQSAAEEPAPPAEEAPEQAQEEDEALTP